MEARGFYAILIAATTIGVALNFTSIDPVKALIWSAVINGVISVPIMAGVLLMAGEPPGTGPVLGGRGPTGIGWHRPRVRVTLDPAADLPFFPQLRGPPRAPKI